MKLVGGLLVKDKDKMKYLKDTFSHMFSYCDEVVILNTLDDETIISTLKKYTPYLYTECCNENESEVFLHKKLWCHILDRNPDWLFIINVDEKLDDAIFMKIDELLNNTKYDAWGFRVYDVDKKKYVSKKSYVPCIVRNLKGYNYMWRERPYENEKFPRSVYNLNMGKCSIKLNKFIVN